MQGGAVRVIRRSPDINHSQTILLVLIFLLPMFSPISSVSAETRLGANDFEILDDLNQVLSERANVISSELVQNLAGPSLEGVVNSVLRLQTMTLSLELIICFLILQWLIQLLLK